MEPSMVILGLVQFVALLVYRWVGKVFLSQPSYNHPGIFFNPVARQVLVNGPLVTMLGMVILAFVLTEVPWLFLGLSVAGFIACSTRPNSEFGP